MKYHITHQRNATMPRSCVWLCDTINALHSFISLTFSALSSVCVSSFTHCTWIWVLIRRSLPTKREIERDISDLRYKVKKSTHSLLEFGDSFAFRLAFGFSDTAFTSSLHFLSYKLMVSSSKSWTYLLFDLNSNVFSWAPYTGGFYSCLL